MFYDPIQGFEITRPHEFGIGVAKGATSLVKKTVFGLSDTFSKLSGSLGKGKFLFITGLAVMTMDEKYQERRRLASRNRPEHIGGGVTSGAFSFARSVTSGIFS
jgi:vacuolar protein sorting-associated protein 13A/C